MAIEVVSQNDTFEALMKNARRYRKMWDEGILDTQQ